MEKDGLTFGAEAANIVARANFVDSLEGILHIRFVFKRIIAVRQAGP